MSRLFKNFRWSAKETPPENRKTSKVILGPSVANSSSVVENPISALEIRRRTNPIKFDEGFEIGFEGLSDIKCEVGVDKWFDKWSDGAFDGGFGEGFDGVGCECDCDCCD